MDKYDYIFNELKKRVDDRLLPGFSLLICKNGQKIYQKSYIYKENAIFRLASMTKPITAVAALKAEELGLINIEDEINKYIDGFDSLKIGRMENGIPVFERETSKRITIKDILRHQSGIGSDAVGFYFADHRTLPLSLKEGVNQYKEWFLDFEPRSKALYSGTTALDIVAYIIEITSKMPYQEFLKKHIFEPLDMNDTTYQLNSEQKQRLVPMFNLVSHENKIEMKPLIFNSFTGFDGMFEGYPSGTAGLMSSIEDYSHFAMMLAGKGIYNDVRILSEDSIDKMSKDIISLPTPGVDEYFNWGYCVYVRGKLAEWQPLKKGTFGWSGAYSSHFFVNTDDNTAVVMMTNICNDGGSASPNIKILEKAYAEIEK